MSSVTVIVLLKVFWLILPNYWEVSQAQATPTIDPIIVWPHGSPSLASMIDEMQRLNPNLGLRCVTSNCTSADHEKIPSGLREMLSSPSTDEFLLYAGTALDVVTIAMPETEKPSDEMMSGLTEVNREWGSAPTANFPFQSGPRRIERTANGALLIRPRSDAVESMFGYFGWAYQEDCPMSQIGRIQSRWGIFHDPHELWEVDFAYLPQYVFNRGLDGEHLPPDPRTPKGNYAFWRTVPVGTVSYIDRYDLSLETHFARAREIVSMGAEFSVVGDVETGELFVFTLAGVTRTKNDIRIPEMHWFDVPAKANWDEGK